MNRFNIMIRKLIEYNPFKERMQNFRNTFKTFKRSIFFLKKKIRKRCQIRAQKETYVELFSQCLNLTVKITL